MSVHKAGKYRNLTQGLGLLHLNSLQSGGASGTSDFGYVAEYNNASTTTYTGLVRHTDGTFYMFDGLTANPFGTGVVPTDAVNVLGAGFALAPLKVGALSAPSITATTGSIVATAGSISATAGSVTGGLLSLSGSTLTNTATAGAVNIFGGSTGGIITLGQNTDVVLLNAAPTLPLGVATKGYVDALAQGLTYKNECVLRTTQDLAGITGGITIAGSNTTHTITSTTNVTLAASSAYFDGQTNLVVGNRVLVMSQGLGAGLAKDNGIYTVTSVGSGSTPWQLTRASDANISADFQSGAATFVNEGTLYASTGWVLTTIGTITLETTSLNFAQFSQLGATTGNQLDSNGFNVYSNQTGGQLYFRGLLYTNTSGSNTTAILQATQTANDITLNIDSSKILGTGALASGSIATGFGTISTTNTITTTAAVTAATLQTTGGLLAASSGTLSFAAGTGNNVVSIADNLADALSIKDGAISFLQFATTTGAQLINVNKPLSINANSNIQFNSATGTNLIQLQNNLASALNVADVAGNSYIKFVSSTAAPTVAVSQLATFSQLVTVNADCNLNGGLSQNVTAITNSTTLTSAFSIVNATAGATTLTVTLPAASANIGRQYKIAKIDNGAGAVTVAVTSGDYIDGVQNDTVILGSQYDHVMVSCQYSGGVGYWFVY